MLLEVACREEQADWIVQQGKESKGSTNMARNMKKCVRLIELINELVNFMARSTS